MPDKPYRAPFECRLRVRDELRQRIAAAARRRGVSKTQEMVARLERSFEPDPIVELCTTMKQLLAMQGGKVDA
jgi:hypothetical protein